jgi:hypothetical protein
LLHELDFEVLDVDRGQHALEQLHLGRLGQPAQLGGGLKHRLCIDEVLVIQALAALGELALVEDVLDAGPQGRHLTQHARRNSSRLVRGNPKDENLLKQGLNGFLCLLWAGELFLQSSERFAGRNMVR